MTTSGAFAWYAVWCVIGWWMILLFVPETRGLTLEQLDQVFEKPTRQYMNHGMDQLKWFFRYYVQRKTYLRGQHPVFLKEDQPEREHDPYGDTEPTLNTHELTQVYP
jgi:hypothetical protein